MASANRVSLLLLLAAAVTLLGLSGLSAGCARGLGRSPSDSDGEVNGDGRVSAEEAGPGPQTCGDGVVDPGEVCDDGNTVDGDDCRSDCLQDLSLCGDGTLDPGESCDDGNTADGDGCSAICQSEGCDAPSCPSGCCDALGGCGPGTQDTACGSGGQLCQDCSATGMICQNRQCQDLGECTPGDTQSCGNCGTRTCNSSGQWGSCAGQGVCAQGDTRNCNDCGRQTCTASCDWGLCQPHDACPGGVPCESGGVCDYHCTNVTWGTHTYYFCSFGLSWVDARQACEIRGQYLVTVNTHAENTWVVDTAVVYGMSVAWIGINDMTQEGNWEWVYGSSGYTNWYAGNDPGCDPASAQPDGGNGENCASFGWFAVCSMGRKWNDLPCNSTDYELGFVCEDG